MILKISNLTDVGVFIMAASMLGIIVSLMLLLIKNKKAHARAFATFYNAFVLGYLVLFFQNPDLVEVLPFLKNFRFLIP